MDINKLLKADPALYADMFAGLQQNESDVVYDSETALWLKAKGNAINSIAALELSEAAQILARVPKDESLVLRGAKGLREMAEQAGFNGVEPCWQVVYQKAELLPVNTELVIRHPKDADFPKVAQTYHLVSEQELRRDFDREDFIGGYLGEALVGYIGLHAEGSMGLLYIFPEYRRRGFAEALYATLINNQIEKGRVPYAQIIDGNEASMALQRKLGFTVSDDLVYWMWHEA